MSVREHRVPFDDGRTLRVVDRGAGPPVLFGHSLLCDGTMFDAQAADLARDHRVLVVDARGHGASDVPRGGYTMLDVGEDHLRVLDHLGVERAVLVGLSMGAMAAMVLGFRHPGRVAGLVLMDVNAGGFGLLTRMKWAAMSALARLLGPRDFLLDPVLSELFGPTFRGERPDVVAALKGRIAAMDPRAVGLAAGALNAWRGVEADLPRISARTLVVVGEEDQPTPRPMAERLAAAVPGARLAVVPRAGHLSALERPAEVTALLREILGDLGW